jgi:hypothetical protein
MVRHYLATKTLSSRLVGLALAGGMLTSHTGAQSAIPAAPAPQPETVSRYHHNNTPSRRAEVYYGLLWGVDSLGVKSVESGELIRFSYRVLDPERAGILNDKKLEPMLIDPQAKVKLVIPSLEKVGQLRQSSTPVAGKSYWMAFSNKGRPVKPGHRVTVVIGRFKAEGLLVE